jgi:uncharacterized protein
MQPEAVFAGHPLAAEITSLLTYGSFFSILLDKVSFFLYLFVPLGVKGMFVLKTDEIPEEGLNLNWAEDRPALMAYLETLSPIDFEFEAPLQSEARISKMGQSILIEGTVQTRLRLRCVRCLNEFVYPLSSTFELTLHSIKEAAFPEEAELDREDMEKSFFEGGGIHLSEIACGQVFLEIPYQPLCQEKCKGLCPVCGKDLNLSSCDCVKEEFHSGFSALQKLKLD